jgi:S-(hydroxymethyl)glutathione dehydrogenase/alcohol dehydrogenase
MKAALYVGESTGLSLEQVKPNPPGPRDVVVEVGASGVCHSDLSIMRGYVPVPPGMVLGHEGAGRVVEVGAEVARVKKGDRVIASFVPACGACWHCLREQTELCERETEVSMAMRGSRPDGSPYFCMTGLGTFSEAMTVDEVSLVKVETDLPDAQLALIGCGVTTGVGAALNTAAVKPGASVAVLGCGGVGPAVIQGAHRAGRIIAIDPQG